MIETRHLCKCYGPLKVIDDVSLAIPSGGINTIIGANGAGKSTLLGVLARLLTVDDGVVSIDGRPLSEWNSAQLATRLAYLRQNTQITLRLSVRDLVSFGRYPYSKGRLDSQDLQKIDTALHYTDMARLADRFLDQLSGGQRQRAFIAMILAQDTDYILLDEPLNGLDLKHAVEMLRLLRQLADDAGKTLIMVLHDINFAAAWSDRIFAMKQGKLLFSGSPAEIMQAPKLAEIYDMTLAVQQIDNHPAALYWIPGLSDERQTDHSAAPDFVRKQQGA
jgi:iron complex transport system ATP-binding protein